MGSGYLYVTISDLSKAEILWRVARSDSSLNALNIIQQRVKLESSSYSSPTTYFEVSGFCADNAVVLNFQDHGINDSGTTSPTTVDSKNWNSATKAIYRSASLSLTNGNRFYVNRTATTNTQLISSGLLVIETTSGAAAATGYMTINKGFWGP